MRLGAGSATKVIEVEIPKEISIEAVFALHNYSDVEAMSTPSDQANEHANLGPGEADCDARSASCTAFLRSRQARQTDDLSSIMARKGTCVV
jgi:hypothetical protein